MPDTVKTHDLVRDYVAIDNTIREAEAKLKDLKAQRLVMADSVLDAMTDDGTPSVEILTDTGTAKVFPVNKLFARRNGDVDEAVFFQALTMAGLGPLVKNAVNANSLSAAVREIAEEHNVRDSGSEAIMAVLPVELREVLTVQTAPSLGLRRS